MPVSLRVKLVLADTGVGADAGLCDGVTPAPAGIEKLPGRPRPLFWNVGWDLLVLKGDDWSKSARPIEVMDDRLALAAEWLSRQSAGAFDAMRAAGVSTSIAVVVGGTDGDEVHPTLPPEFLRACGMLGLEIALSFIWVEDI